VSIHTNVIIKNVVKLSADMKDKFLIECEGIDYIADTVVFATGSKAAPKTGSDGSGYELIKKLGIKVIKPLPALVQLIGDEKELYRIAAGVR